MIETTASRPLSSTGCAASLNVPKQVPAPHRREAFPNTQTRSGRKSYGRGTPCASRCRPVLITIDVVQRSRAIAREPSFAIPREITVPRTTPENAFVSRHPLHADGWTQWPAPLPKHSLLTARCLSAALQTPFRANREHASIARAHPQDGEIDFAATEVPVVDTGPDIGIAEQRQDRVIERRRRNLDRSPLRRFRMCRQYPCRVFPLPWQLRASGRPASKCSPLPYQRGHVLLFKKKLVKPRNLRQHLQVGKVAAAWK